MLIIPYSSCALPDSSNGEYFKKDSFHKWNEEFRYNQCLWLYLAYDGFWETLTSFKTARLATELDYIDKVIFVVDRKDLDYQTMKEYQKFQPNSVNGSNNTKELQRSIEENDDRIGCHNDSKS